MKVFLDDIRIPKDCISYMHTRIGTKNPIYLDDWIVSRNVNDFKAVVKAIAPSITHVSFDHDLADSHYETVMTTLNEEEYESLIKNSEETGYEAAQWLIEYYKENDYKLPEIIVHSMNPAGRSRIESLFQ